MNGSNHWGTLNVISLLYNFWLLLHFLSQLRLPDLVQGVLGGGGRFSNIVPESIFHHVQAGLGRLLPQDVGIATCG